jgi:transcriptional regulator with XRE-family HTH domain
MVGKMRAATPNLKLVREGAGEMLRYWREIRRLSQLVLSVDSGVSQRHISFIESGRSVPSRQILMDLAETLEIPLRDRNVLLLAAGYAPLYSEGAADAVEMQGIMKALKRILWQNEPYPALVMDRYWNILMTNDALPRLFNRFTNMSTRTDAQNILHMIFDPAGLRPHIAHWDNLAMSLIQRVHRESVGRHVDEKTHKLLNDLLAYPDVPAEWRSPKALSSATTSPVVPLGLVREGKILSYFSMVSTVGTPQTAAAQELRLECMLPVDEETERLHEALLRQAH